MCVCLCVRVRVVDYRSVGLSVCRSVGLGLSTSLAVSVAASVVASLLSLFVAVVVVVYMCVRACTVCLRTFKKVPASSLPTAPIILHRIADREERAAPASIVASSALPSCPC